MRVTQIFNVYLEKGGEENYVDFLEDQFRGDDRFATLRFYSSDWKKAGAPNKLMQALKMYHNREALERLREHERVFESDVWLLHNIFPVGSAAIFALARKRGIRTVVVTHNFRPFSVSGYLWADHGVAKTGLRKNFFPEIREGAWRSSSLQTAWYAILLWVLHARGTFRKVSHWIAISDFMREQFIGAGIDPERITTLKHVLPIRPLENFDCKDEGYYLYLGRLVEMKGLRFLVEAWESLGSEGPLLKICGDGPEEAWLRKRVKNHPSIQYCGKVAGVEKRQLLEGCRALVVPSLWWEPFGLVVYEAYEVGKAVIVADGGALPELVRDAITGRHFETGNQNDFLEKIRQSEACPENLVEMGRQGRRYLEECGQIGVWKKHLWDILTQASSSSVS